MPSYPHWHWKKRAQKGDYGKSLRSKFDEIVLENWSMMYEIITGACKMVKKLEFGWVADTS